MTVHSWRSELALSHLVTQAGRVEMRRRDAALVVALIVSSMVTACAARPRTRPLQTTPISEGPATLEATRKALEGRWTLVGLSLTAEDGRTAPIEATGVLNSEAFGNLQIEYRMSDAGQKALAGLGIKTPNAVISTSGRVVIDPQQRSITYVAEDFEKRALAGDPELAARRANPFALERVRYYVIGNDGTLVLSTRYDNGKDALVSRWKKDS
jgi:hypothetical protein